MIVRRRASWSKEDLKPVDELFVTARYAERKIGYSPAGLSLVQPTTRSVDACTPEPAQV